MTTFKVCMIPGTFLGVCVCCIPVCCSAAMDTESDNEPHCCNECVQDCGIGIGIITASACFPFPLLTGVCAYMGNCYPDNCQQFNQWFSLERKAELFSIGPRPQTMDD